LDDGVLFDMDLQQLNRAMAPKVDGAWNLHTATRDAPLDFFVLFSSVACLLGSPGQANYAAGNAFLDGLAHYRRSLGMPATSINWGPWADSGMAATAERSGQVQSRGVELIAPQEGLKVLADLLQTRPVSAAVMNIDWGELLRLMPRRKPSLLHDIDVDAEQTMEDDTENEVDHQFRRELLSAGAKTQKLMLSEYFCVELARIMGIDAAELDADEPLNQLGLDSLMAMELKNKLESRLRLDLPMSRFMEGPSVNALVKYAAESLGSPSNSNGTDTRVEALADWSAVVPLQTGGDKPPLYCVHPIGGDVRCYFDLGTQLQGTRPVFALRARGIDTPLPRDLSVEGMAHDYVEAIQRFQPSGPYFLAGWSTGGIFAYEIARRLIEQGDDLGAIMLLDTPTSKIFRNVDLNDDAKFLSDLVNFSNWFAGAQMSVRYAELREQNADQRLQTVLHEAKQHGVVAPHATADHIRRLIDVSRAHVRAILKYTPRPFGENLHLFRPTETTVLADASGQHVDDDLGWTDLVGERVQFHKAPGDHFSMMRGEHARHLAVLLNGFLDVVGTAS
jgi:myxalamid-type polyketide synthase MxaB